MARFISTDERYALIDARVTLNGKPAKISGARMQFAMVAALDGSMEFEWSWDAVARIVTAGGKFKA